MTAKGESQLMAEINNELDTLYSKFREQDTALGAALVTLDALVVTLDAAIDVITSSLGSAAGADLVADLAAAVTDATSVEVMHTSAH